MKTNMIITSLFFAMRAFGFQPVDINTASSEQIALLPGVGATLAHHIVEFRGKNGPLTRAEGLLKIAGMTEKKLDLLKTKIIFSSPTKKNRSPEPKPPEPVLVTWLPKPVMGLRELEIQVLKANGLSMDTDQSLASRVRKSPFLPKLAAYFDVDRGQTTAEKFSEYSQDPVLRRGGDKFGIGVRATFELDKLIFNSDELEVAKLSLKRLEKREELMAKLHKNYFRYLSLVAMAQKPLDSLAAETIIFEMSQLEALLDTMSMGAFMAFQKGNKP